ncbi:acetyltransferase, ribosomal protein N-acetylase [Polaromonas sp. CF318]|uniref:GNAT family N-acetyltransferase n=1 Tax=Polaromonas sp. CF318 TaxID=1144318 RepID=UPI00027144C8|nr:GNAT family N-acetyltransferase [Polaromonas sp. CF318]EJL81260.1 acetyltransferase, ribosomal protein N-acetylase [Polaromonas sp. CF318]
MRSRQPESTDPAFLNEKTARKQAERQLLLDALAGGLDAAPIAWAPGNATVIAPGLLASPRLQLRPWKDADRDPFAAMTADPEVMRHFPAPLSRAQSDAWIDRMSRKIEERGWGFWAMDYLAEGAAPQFAGFTGLHIPDPELPFGPCVEVGWRLAQRFWGLGLATEAARLSLRAGFESLGLQEIVAMTTLRNTRSRAVMQRLGMQESPGDEFDHWAYPADSPERRCCIYRLPRARWSADLHAPQRAER